MSESVIKIENLTKQFRGFRSQTTAVDGLSLNVPAGSVFGFLGTNGAGKTTTIRMLLGHLYPSDGQISVFGNDPRDHDEQTRQRIASVTELMALPRWMTADKAIRLNEAWFPKFDVTLAHALISEFRLERKKRFSRLSKGQKQLVLIVLALCQQADLLILDEPTAGMDVVARHKFLKRILDIACEQGSTVFFSSHQLSDLERVVDRIAIIEQGRLMVEGELDALKAGVRKLIFPVYVAREQIAEQFQLLDYDESDLNHTVATVFDFDPQRLNALCEVAECPGNVQTHGLNLEEMFVELVHAEGGENTNDDNNWGP